MTPALPTPAEVDAFLAREFPSAHASGVGCVELTATYAVARWRYDPTTLRPGALISGPTQFAIADTALWFMTFAVLGLAPMAVTSSLAIDFLRPAAGGDLLARADLLRAGRTKITGAVRLWVDGAPERLVAHAVGTYMRIGAAG